MRQVDASDFKAAIAPPRPFEPGNTRTDRAVSFRQARVKGFPRRHVDAIESGACDLSGPRGDAWKQITQAVRNRGLVLLHGKRGVGKTHLLALLGIEWDYRGFAGRYGVAKCWRVNDLLGEQKRWYGRKFDDNGNAIAEPLEVARDCGLLVLDEVNEIRSDSEHDHESVVRLVDARYANAMPTVLATNLATDDLPSVLGWSILDRVKDNGALIACNWDNYRDRIRAAGGAA